MAQSGHTGTKQGKSNKKNWHRIQTGTLNWQKNLNVNVFYLVIIVIFENYFQTEIDLIQTLGRVEQGGTSFQSGPLVNAFYLEEAHTHLHRLLWTQKGIPDDGDDWKRG